MPSLTDEIATIRSLASSGHSPTEIAASIGREIGDVQTVLASVTLPAADSPGSTPSTPALKHIVFPFAFDTPGLTAGVEVYTPTVDEVLLDAWYELNTAWNGTTPLADIGTFVNAAAGIFNWFDQAAPLDVAADNPDGQGDGMVLSNGGSALSVVAAAMAQPLPAWPGGHPQTRFTATHPLKVVVSQDGTAGGLDPAATKGAAQLHLLVLPAP